MTTVTSLKNGTAFELDGQPFLVLKYLHTALGRKKARVKLTIRNLKTGALLTRTFLSDKKLLEIELEKKQLAFLYFDGRQYYFQDQQGGEFEISKENLNEKGKFLKKRETVEVIFWRGTPLFVELPIFVNFKVKEAPPGIKGNSSENAFKPVRLENGFKIKAPLFINSGDIIKVDTRSGEYVERIS